MKKTATDRRIALVAGAPVSYRVRRSDRARRVTLHVDRRDGLVVVLPRRVPADEAERFIAAQADWVARQVDRHGVRNGPVVRQYATGSAINVLGRPRRLRILPLPASRRRSTVRLEDDELVAELAPADVFDPRPVLERWLRALARREIPGRVAAHADAVGAVPSRIVIGERRSRWGSCSGRGTLSFCYRLVMAPPEVIDAVVIHELCHLRHLDHGRRFRALVARLCPEHDARMDWLRRHEDDLQL